MSVYHKENANFFDLALESNLVKQTLSPNEFVLVCDGELTEDLDSVIKKYSELFPNIFKVYRKENGGLGKALNFGLPKCTYPLVARSDSDDICDEKRFEQQVTYMDEHPNVSIVGSYIDEFETDWKHPTQRKQLPLTHEDLVEMAKFRNPMNHMAVMFRRNDILRIGSYRHIPYVEDYELWVRAIVEGLRLANIDDYLVHARVGNGMLARRGNKKYIHSWHILNRYMIENNMIGSMTYLRNMVAIIGFVYTPTFIKDFLYKRILRKA